MTKFWEYSLDSTKLFGIFAKKNKKEMIKIKFNNTEELCNFIIEQGIEETMYMTNPDYIEAIVGLANDNKLVYDYWKMVDVLAEEYADDYENPHEAAMEWIDFNCNMPYWYIVDSYSDEDIGVSIDDETTSEIIQQYRKAFVGMSTHGIIMFDEELLTEEEMDSIEKKVQEDYYEVMFI